MRGKVSSILSSPCLFLLLLLLIVLSLNLCDVIIKGSGYWTWNSSKRSCTTCDEMIRQHISFDSVTKPASPAFAMYCFVKPILSRLTRVKDMSRCTISSQFVGLDNEHNKHITVTYSVSHAFE
ncbi:hypothetical protein YC2023_084015 [Brassica napus]